MTYKSPRTDTHTYEEELQWARILAQGEPRKSMILVLVQKLCTAFHEYEPAWREGALDSNHFEFVKKRVLNRIDDVITTAETNQLGQSSAVNELREQRDKIRAAESAEQLFGMTEEMHDLAHRICDFLEQN